LGASAKLLKATVGIVTPVRPSLRIEQLGSQWKKFHESP